MACFGCAERLQALGQMLKNVASGQSVKPQVQQIRTSVRNDLNAIKMRLNGGR